MAIYVMNASFVIQAYIDYQHFLTRFIVCVT
jgi:hypothetical protein